MDNERTPHTSISVGDWMLTLFITFIPIVCIVMLFVWGFSSNTQANKATWAKAALIWIAIFLAIDLLLFLFLGFSILAAVIAASSNTK